MTKLSVAHIFTTAAVAANFDNQASASALTGRTYGPLHALLLTAYGLDVPAATVGAVKYLNFQLFGADKPPTLVTGEGSKAAVVVITQVLHAYATALRAGLTKPDKINATPEVLGLPAWADPIALAKKKEENKAKREAKQADEAAAELAREATIAAAEAIVKAAGGDVTGAGGDDGAEGEDGTGAPALQSVMGLDVLQAAVSAATPIDPAAAFNKAWNVIAPMLTQGIITTAQRAACIAALEGAVCAAPAIDPAMVSAQRKRAAKGAAKVSASLPKEVAALV